MRSPQLACAALALVLAACGRRDEDEAETATPQAAGSATLAAEPAATSRAEIDVAAILGALNLAPDAAGQVVNECGQRMTPRIVAAELGGAVGTAQLVAIDGGPKQPTCYGDGPDLHLLQRDGPGYREIYSARGRMLVVLPTAHDGVRDVADGAPGFSFPVWQCNGNTYADAGRAVAHSELGEATFLP